jgi:Bacterial PH domain
MDGGTPMGGPARTVFRPRRGRLVVYASAVAVCTTLVVIALLLPSSGASGWGVGSQVAVILMALGVGWFMHRLAAVRVVASPAGVTVVNILTRRQLEWAEIVGVRLLRDDPWMMLDLAEGEQLAAMGVQKADGERAQEQARVFARMVNEHSRTSRND